MADYLIDLEPDEKIVLEVRKHVFVFLLEVLTLAVLLVAPLFAAPALSAYLAETIGRGGTLLTVLYLLWMLVLWVGFFFRWTDYYLDVWVITNKRIFDIEQKGMFNRTTSVFRLERIEDVTVEIHGILATLLKYGDIHIHTAGSHDAHTDSDITISGAHHPLMVKRVIMEACGKAIKEIGRTRQRDI